MCLVFLYTGACAEGNEMLKSFAQEVRIARKINWIVLNTSFQTMMALMRDSPDHPNWMQFRFTINQEKIQDLFNKESLDQLVLPPLVEPGQLLEQLSDLLNSPAMLAPLKARPSRQYTALQALQTESFCPLCRHATDNHPYAEAQETLAHCFWGCPHL